MTTFMCSRLSASRLNPPHRGAENEQGYGLRNGSYGSKADTRNHQLLTHTRSLRLSNAANVTWGFACTAQGYKLEFSIPISFAKRHPFVFRSSLSRMYTDACITVKSGRGAKRHTVQ